MWHNWVSIFKGRWISRKKSVTEIYAPTQYYKDSTDYFLLSDLESNIYFVHRVKVLEEFKKIINHNNLIENKTINEITGNDKAIIRG